MTLKYFARYRAHKSFFQKKSKGHNFTMGDNSMEKKKKTGQLFYIKNPYVKFQDSIFNGSKVTVGIKDRDGRKERRTHGQAKNNMPLQLFQS